MSLIFFLPALFIASFITHLPMTMGDGIFIQAFHSRPSLNVLRGFCGPRRRYGSARNLNGRRVSPFAHACSCVSIHSGLCCHLHILDPPRPTTACL
ncbi:hypothetical protein C8R46DRAFT_1082967, partial [Mycena filopes]